MDRAVEELAWARQSGLFGGAMLPAMSVTSGPPGYADEYYEPFWSACEDHQMVVNLHTGASGAATDTKFLDDAKHGGMLGLYEVFVFTRRPLWFMIFGGVFDRRHPDLKVAVTENGVQWLPSLIRDMESFFDTHGGAPVRSYSRHAPGRLLRPPRLHGWLADEALRGRDAPRDRHRPAHVGSGLPPSRGSGSGAPSRPSSTSSAGCPRATCVGCSASTPSSCGASTSRCSRRVADRVGPTVGDLSVALPIEDIPLTFSWSLARPVPLVSDRQGHEG